MNLSKLLSNNRLLLVFSLILNITSIIKTDSEHLNNDLKLENSTVSPFEDKVKIEKLFFKYANNNEIMNSAQMNKFLDHLAEIFGDFYNHEHGSVPDDNYELDGNDDEKREDKQVVLNKKQTNDKERHDHDHDHDHHDHEHDHEEANSPVDNSKNPKVKCLKERLNKLKSNSPNLKMNKTGFAFLSSSILANLADCTCFNLTKNETIQSTPLKTVYNPKNWFFAFLSAFIISVIGLLCYLVVPSLNTYCFNYLFQFLVALAVGTLSGDSLLHLIPHAFMEKHDHNGHEDHNHNEGVFKGLGAVVGIYVFYVIEKIMQIRRARKEKRHKQTEIEAENEKFLAKSLGQTKEELSSNQNSTNGKEEHAYTDLSVEYKMAKHVHNDHELDLKNQFVNQQGQPLSMLTRSQQLSQCNSTSGDPACLVIHGNKELKYISNYLPNNVCKENIDHHDHENEKEHLHQHRENFKEPGFDDPTVKDIIANISGDTQSKLLIDNPQNCVCVPLEESVKEIKESPNGTLKKKEPSKMKHSHSHNHSHSHGHSHKSHVYMTSREKAHHDHHKKHEKEIDDIKLIAWMVLMGDGLHNFSDGLAIGVSFASSLTTGFGTAIAVLCHELPHEIGDFAVLRRAGVSLKRALVFNAVSGVLCLLGVLVGLLIGRLQMLTSWSFLFIAGTFLYISLVDMIPELSEDKADDSIVNFFIQSSGILTGVGIMLAIALLESKFTKLFSSTSI